MALTQQEREWRRRGFDHPYYLMLNQRTKDVLVETLNIYQHVIPNAQPIECDGFDTYSNYRIMVDNALANGEVRIAAYMDTQQLF